VTLQDILAALWRRRFILEIGAVIAVVLGLATVVARGVEYSAQSQILIAQPQLVAPGGDTGLLTQQKLNLLVGNYARIASTPGFVSEALRKAGLAGAANVTGDTVQNSSIFKIVVHASSKRRARDVAVAMQDGIRSFIASSQAGVPGALRIQTLVLERPTPRFVSNDPAFIVIAAFIAGLAIAATIVLLLENP